MSLVRSQPDYDSVFVDMEAYFRSIGERGWADEIRAHLTR